MRQFFTLLVLSITITTSFAQEQTLTLEDAVTGQWGKFRPETYQQYGWIPNEDTYWWIDDEGLFKAAAENKKGKSIIALAEFAEQFPDSVKVPYFPAIHWIDNSSFYFTIRKNHGVYRFNTQSKKLTLVTQLPANAQNVDIQTSNFNIAYTIDNKLYVQQANGNIAEVGLTGALYNGFDEIAQKTTDQNTLEEKDVVYGQAVHRYEFGISKGTFWSNDGKMLAFYRNDQSAVYDYPLPSYAQIPAKDNTIKYPMAGQASETVTLGIYDLAKNNIVFLEDHWDDGEYITNIAWDPTNQFIYAIELNRDQNIQQLNKFDAVSGNFIKTVSIITDEKYVHPDMPIEFLTNGSYVFVQEQKGYKAFNLYTSDDRLIGPLETHGIIVDAFLNATQNVIYFAGYPTNSIERHVYSINTDIKPSRQEAQEQRNALPTVSAPVPLIQYTEVKGSHSAKVSSSGNYILDAFSNGNIPYQLDLINTQKRKADHLIEAKDPLKDYQLAQTEILTIDAEDGTSLFARMIKPSDFDASKKYPVVVYVYNGSNVQLITERWMYGAPLWMHYLANKGYIVFTVDGRGSANRGVEFEQATFRNLGQVEMRDQLTGVYYLKKQPYIDSERMAVHGWSFGGFMTLSLMTNYPDVFKVGVAGGPVTDWSLYEVMYTERYMDTPETNPEGYAATSVVQKAKDITGDVLVIHGVVDDVVVPQNSMNFLKACVDNQVQVDFFMYPGHPHNVRGKDRVHLMEKVIKYIEDHL